MSKAGSQNNQDNFVAYVAAAVVVGLVTIFVFTWSHVRATHQDQPQIAFAHFGPYQVETQDFSLTATLAVQINIANASWADNNRQVLNIIFKKVLADTDPAIIKAPHGLQVLQEALTKGSNSVLSTKNVQTVLLTDFVFQGRDS